MHLQVRVLKLMGYRRRTSKEHFPCVWSSRTCKKYNSKVRHNLPVETGVICSVGTRQISAKEKIFEGINEM